MKSFLSAVMRAKTAPVKVFARFASVAFWAILITATAKEFADARAADAKETAAQSAQKIISVGNYSVTVEIAKTAAARKRGLSNRKTASPMLFVFNPPQKVCMWMRGVNFNADAAFINQNGDIIKIAKMKKHAKTRHCSDGVVGYVLETPQGFFNQQKITLGVFVDGLEKL